MPVRKLKPIEERDPYAALVLAAWDEMETDTAMPKADCDKCKYMRLPHSGHCYMFKARPGDACAQFKSARPNVELKELTKNE